MEKAPKLISRNNFTVGHCYSVSTNPWVVCGCWHSRKQRMIVRRPKNIRRLMLLWDCLENIVLCHKPKAAVYMTSKQTTKPIKNPAQSFRKKQKGT